MEGIYSIRSELLIPYLSPCTPEKDDKDKNINFLEKLLELPLELS
jgi:hypothetical protein